MHSQYLGYQQLEVFDEYPIQMFQVSPQSLTKIKYVLGQFPDIFMDFDNGSDRILHNNTEQ
jgi:hypothetical protein